MFGAKVKQALKGLTARNGGVDLTPTMPNDVSAAVELYLEDAKNTGAAIAVACERANGTGRVIAWKATGAHAEIASLEYALAQRFPYLRVRREGDGTLVVEPAGAVLARQ